MVRYGMVWYIMVWYVMLWYGTARYGKSRHGMVRYDTVTVVNLRYDNMPFHKTSRRASIEISRENMQTVV